MTTCDARAQLSVDAAAKASERAIRLMQYAASSGFVYIDDLLIGAPCDRDDRSSNGCPI
jgi:hypothetical protein